MRCDAEALVALESQGLRPRWLKVHEVVIEGKRERSPQRQPEDDRAARAGEPSVAHGPGKDVRRPWLARVAAHESCGSTTGDREERGDERERGDQAEHHADARDETELREAV